ncbi:MAG: dihydrodipicolinate reductase C-terminal domain-containing protein [Bacteroidota bacterium]
MRIALIGYGKMGKTIERLAKQQGHEIVLVIDRHNTSSLTTEALQRAEVAIEFTQPGSAYHNILRCFEAGIPVVSGTTGWDTQFEAARQQCIQHSATLLHATNFSVGVNIFFAINERLAALMEHQPQYAIGVEEVHHTEKLDAPSGTAITLATGILQQVTRKTNWINEDTPSTSEQLPIVSKRIDQVPGTHQVTYRSLIDTIDIKHTAHTRDGFAMGAILAASNIK